MKVIIILGIATFANAPIFCQTIINTKMDNKLDFKLLDKYAEKSQREDTLGTYFEYYWSFTDKKGTESELFGNIREGFVVSQTPPKPAFYHIYKEYFPNGNLKEKGKFLGEGTMIGEWEYYNETGQLVSKKNEDAKFGRFGCNELLSFLHQQKHINVKTGENREKIRIVFNEENKQWFVRTTNPRYWIIEYVINGETGEIIDKKEYQGGFV